MKLERHHRCASDPCDDDSLPAPNVDVSLANGCSPSFEAPAEIQSSLDRFGATYAATTEHTFETGSGGGHEICHCRDATETESLVSFRG